MIRVESDIQEIKGDLKEVKTAVGSMLREMAVNNHILAEHERRSTNLETRMEPIEDSYKFTNRIVTVFLSGGGIVSLIAVIDLAWRIFSKH